MAELWMCKCGDRSVGVQQIHLENDNCSRLRMERNDCAIVADAREEFGLVDGWELCRSYKCQLHAAPLAQSYAIASLEHCRQLSCLVCQRKLRDWNRIEFSEERQCISVNVLCKACGWSAVYNSALPSHLLTPADRQLLTLVGKMGPPALFADPALCRGKRDRMEVSLFRRCDCQLWRGRPSILCTDITTASGLEHIQSSVAKSGAKIDENSNKVKISETKFVNPDVFQSIEGEFSASWQ